MATLSDFIFTKGLSDPFARGATEQKYAREVKDGMTIEKHVSIPLRNCLHAFCDIYRPTDESIKVAPLISWTPYGKHDPAPLLKIYPNCGVDPSWISDYTAFEAPDPVYWTKHGYAIIIIDVAGLWLGEGNPTFSSGTQEAEYHYDCIEWIASQAWSAGKVGLSGVSYLAVSQWHVAALRPPSLGCIVPDEGWSDFYREVMRHGGIPDTSFFPYIAQRWGACRDLAENLIEESRARPFFDDFWATKRARLENIQCPALVIASFSDQGLHTRGTLEGFKKISSKEKWLIVHRKRKWEYYYTPEVVEKQRAFYDKFLKGCTDTQVNEWPKVLIEVSNSTSQSVIRAEKEWPLARQILTPFYLDACSERLMEQSNQESAYQEYHSLGGGPERVRAVFDITFDADTEVTGQISANLFMSTNAGNDMDVFTAIYKLDKSGRPVGQIFFAQYDDGPVTLGWLRASRRELDPHQSTPDQPVHLHERDLPVESQKVYELNVEMWASSTTYLAGESLRLIVQGCDIARETYPNILTRHETEQVNQGYHKIWTGADHKSHLLLPIIGSKF